MKRIAALIVVGMLTLGIGSAVADNGVVGDANHQPPRPNFVQVDGTISNMPAWLPVADGGWVRASDLMAPPPARVNGKPQQSTIPVYDRPDGTVIGTLSNGEGR